MHRICLFQMQILLVTFEINLLWKMIRAGEGPEYSIVSLLAPRISKTVSLLNNQPSTGFNDGQSRCDLSSQSSSTQNRIKTKEERKLQTLAHSSANFLSTSKDIVNMTTEASFSPITSVWSFLCASINYLSCKGISQSSQRWIALKESCGTFHAEKYPHTSLELPSLVWFPLHCTRELKTN